jgi:hypothetical protein
MLLIPVPEEVAFDYLSVLEVKHEHGLPTEQEIAQLVLHLCRHEERFGEIVDSLEYGALHEANRVNWGMVDRAIRDECAASEVDRANHVRSVAKRALRDRWWPKSAVVEHKQARPYRDAPGLHPDGDGTRVRHMTATSNLGTERNRPS